jgi:hypothetical protein
MTSTPQLSEELSAGPAKLRIDVDGAEPLDHVLDDMSFLNYRLADVRISPEVSLAVPDIVWHRDADKGIAYDGRTMTLTGAWPAGPIQKVVVTMLALRIEAVGLHPFHASAVRYRDKTVLFLGGESNHGKSMGQIEACKRGALLVSTETTVIDEAGTAVMGSREPFLKKRTEGTARADKAPNRGGEVLRHPAGLVVRATEQGRHRHRACHRWQLRPVERAGSRSSGVPDSTRPELSRQRAVGARFCHADGRHGSASEARVDFVRRFAERPYIFIRRYAAGVLDDGSGALGPGDASSRTSGRPISTTLSPPAEHGLTRVRWREGPI